MTGHATHAPALADSLPAYGTRMGWQVIETATAGVHILPYEDYRPHTATAECWCRPVENEWGAYEHPALDGRELVEDGQRAMQ